MGSRKRFGRPAVFPLRRDGDHLLQGYIEDRQPRRALGALAQRHAGLLGSPVGLVWAAPQAYLVSNQYRAVPGTSPLMYLIIPRFAPLW
jgi:hypothetical protein